MCQVFRTIDSGAPGEVPSVIKAASGITDSLREAPSDINANRGFSWACSKPQTHTTTKKNAKS
jgi:hypothetical protein